MARVQPSAVERITWCSGFALQEVCMLIPTVDRLSVFFQSVIIVSVSHGSCYTHCSVSYIMIIVDDSFWVLSMVSGAAI